MKGKGKQPRGAPQRPPAGNGRPDELPLPRATRQVFPTQLDHCRNVGLLFYRYIRFQPGWQLGTYKDKEKRRDHSARMFNFEAIAKAQEGCSGDDGWTRMHAQFLARWKAGVQMLGAQPFQMTPEWRLVVGLGDKGALEAGLSFQRIYGFPIIPGSALKGLARAAALWEIAEALGVPALPLHEAKERANQKPRLLTPLEKLDAMLLADDERLSQEERHKQELPLAEEKRLKELREDKGIPPGAPVRSRGLEPCRDKVRLFRTAFGTLHAAGQAVFFDSVPAQPPVLKPDVMNVHYQDYYSGKTDAQGRPIPPADYSSPNPIPFLTVGQGSPFLFAVGRRGEQNPQAQEQARKWLEDGLRELGVGAKTAAGYGYMQVL